MHNGIHHLDRWSFKNAMASEFLWTPYHYKDPALYNFLRGMKPKPHKQFSLELT